MLNVTMSLLKMVQVLKLLSVLTLVMGLETYFLQTRIVQEMKQI